MKIYKDFGNVINFISIENSENLTEEEILIKKQEKFLSEGALIDLELVSDEIVFYYKGNVICKGHNEPNLFERRKKFKGVLSEDFRSVNVVRYSSLHTHSEYSILDSKNRINEIVEATEYATALTEHGNMFSALKFQKAMIKAGKKPILGFEAYIEDFEGKGKKDGRKNRYHLILLAKTQKGLKNLLILTSMAYIDNFNMKPTIKHEWLREYSEGVICTSACIGGEIPQAIIRNELDYAKELILYLKDIFKDDFYLEIQRHGIEKEDMVNGFLLKMGKELGVKCIATTDSHYNKKEESKLHEVLLCIRDGKTIDDPKRYVFEGTGYHFHTSSEMEELFYDLPELLDNTLEIADKVEAIYETGNIYMPKFKFPMPFKSEAEYFKYLCNKGFDERYKGDKYLYASEDYKNKIDVEYRERLDFEIETILNMGFPGYFLITWDFIRFAKDKNILVGPGRGSACGSMVSYVLKITDLDPMEYGFLFERFLNPDRISMPDIDVDFQDTRREEVIKYVEEKYTSVSKIITFGTLAYKVVIKDVGRVYNYSHDFTQKITDSIPSNCKTLKDALSSENEFSQMYKTNEDVKKIVDIARGLEGLVRNTSTHACGLVISDKVIREIIPQAMAINEQTGQKEIVTQVTMAECEELGLLKVDFLGLRTMGVVGEALNLINKNRKEEDKLTFENIPLDDLETYEFLSKGETAGVFQLESQGMTETIKQLFQDVENVIKKIKDRNKDLENPLLSEEGKAKGREYFERLIAGISLYRPGPIDEIPKYIKYMLNPSEITYDIPELKDILDATYSVIVYQEQCSATCFPISL